jgi:2-polyprenyl-3-methyl-5-hydroxy-6-metoxy-1,4-benzoquinol methylase
MCSEAYTFVRCRGCGVVYQNPQPTAESLKARYGAEYFEYEIENERNFFGLMLLGLQDIGFDNLRWSPAPSGAPREGRHGRFLDVGCATGMLLEHMRDRGWTVQGVDLCAESARHAREKRGIDVFVGTLEEARFAAGSFAVVHFSHLLEHVRAPRGFMREVRRLLAPGGYAVITTPNIDGFQAKLLGTRWRSAIADHLYLFSPATLRSLLETEEFAVVHTVTWGGIAKGLAPGFVKTPLDRLAKKWGFGDVMLFLATPKATVG